MDILGKGKNKNTNLNYILCGCIIVLLILYVFNTEKTNSNIKVNTIINNSRIEEGFIEPTKMNTPRNFELYKIDKTNNILSCIFSEPTNSIISNQVIKYMLVVNSYILNTDNTNILDDNKQKNMYKLLDTKMIIKDKKEIITVELNKQFKLRFDITLPKVKYNIPDNTNNLENETVEQPIFYRLGLVAIYPNIYSAIVPTSNQTLFTLENEIDYNESQLFSELGQKYKGNKPLSLLEGDESGDDNQNNTTDNYKYEQIKLQLGDYPTNLINFEQTGVKSLSELMKLNTNNTINLILNDYTESNSTPTISKEPQKDKIESVEDIKNTQTDRVEA